MSTVPHKVCTRCGIDKPLSDFGSKGNRLRAECRDCHNISNQAYKAANRDKVRASDAAYREANRAIVNERYRKWSKANPERIAEIAAQSKHIHAEQRYEMNKAYRLAHPELYKAASNNRRARVKGNGGEFTAAEWGQMKADYDYTCLCCGRSEPEIMLTMDHVVPIKLGGLNTADNIQPLCGNCNSRKSAHIIDFRKEGI